MDTFITEWPDDPGPEQLQYMKNEQPFRLPQSFLFNIFCEELMEIPFDVFGTIGIAKPAEEPQ